ncbi:MAG: sensor histidine kinase [Flavobacteriales bacterium]|nr:sensor histidine kinase [Flavobacteriales bacterium]
MKKQPWRVLPLVAIILAISFVAWDLALMTRATRAQQRLEGHMDQLDALSKLGTILDDLLLAHQQDVKNNGRAWSTWLERTEGQVAEQLDRVPGVPGIHELRAQLRVDLAACDSMHREVLNLHTDPAAAEMADAVFALVMQRARNHVEATARLVHTDGLARETAGLSSQWSEAQWLLGMASLLALACALLVGYASRLLDRTRERSELLARTGEELEQRNRELRETMLSKEEKEVMLKEIHHRVKNNLQIVRSLIRFQTDRVSDPRTMELFNECVNRVGAMALVHEQTYLSKDLANIDVSNYLNSLIRDLVAAYNIRVKLRMDVDIRVKTLGVDTLTPLGLLINEVISNSFKHAFTGRQEGTIIVHLSGTEEGGLFLRVGDDGVGLRDGGRWEKPKSLGMELIHTLAGQLNATMSLQPGPGLVYEMISRPETEIRRRA